MPEWITYFAIALLVVFLVAMWVGRSGSAARIADLQRALETERQRANALAGAQAQLETVQQTLMRVQEQEAQLDADLREAIEARSSAEAQLRASVDRRSELDGELLTVRKELATTRDQVQEAQAAAAKAESMLAAVSASRADLQRSHDSAVAVRDEAIERQRQLSVDLEQANAARNAADEIANQARQFVESAREQLKVSFADAASKVFDDKSTLLEQRINHSSQLSKTQLEETLKPFNEQLSAFRQRVETLNESQTRENATLIGAIGELKTFNQEMAAATDSLARALKGNAKIRGNWGEMILETVLKASGLEEGANYVRQAPATDEDTGIRRQPDVVFSLPDGRQVVIDSKVNLIAWAEAHDTDNAEEYHAAMQRHSAALRLHMRDLAEKNYPKVLGGQTLELTVLFVPIEGALSAALAVDPNLQTDAWKNRVAFASPNTLMAMLKIVERLWVRDRLQKQVGIIGDEANKLVDSVAAFLEDFKAIDTRLQQLQGAYTNARNRLSESNQSIVARTQRLVRAGAKGKKLLPEELIPEGEALPLLVDETGE